MCIMILYIFNKYLTSAQITESAVITGPTWIKDMTTMMKSSKKYITREVTSFPEDLSLPS